MLVLVMVFYHSKRNLKTGSYYVLNSQDYDQKAFKPHSPQDTYEAKTLRPGTICNWT